MSASGRALTGVSSRTGRRVVTIGRKDAGDLGEPHRVKGHGIADGEVLTRGGGGRPVPADGAAAGRRASIYALQSVVGQRASRRAGCSVLQEEGPGRADRQFQPASHPIRYDRAGCGGGGSGALSHHEECSVRLQPESPAEPDGRTVFSAEEGISKSHRPAQITMPTVR